MVLPLQPLWVVKRQQVSSAQAVARVAYRWDGDQLVGQQQYLADGTAARAVQWVYEPGSFRPLAQVEGKGDVTRLHYIVTDLTGTARELCSEEGEVHWRGEQALWGNHREERRPIALRRYLGDASNEEVYCELRYQGQLYDAETGLYYNRHRYYDADSGQYLSPDPIGLLGGVRPQGYVTNPFMWCDPLGLEKKGPQNSPTPPGPALPQKAKDSFENGIYKNRQLTKDETFYKYHGIDNRTGNKVSWLTNKKYSSEDVLRQDLAIRRDWGVTINKVSEFNIPKGTWVSEGTAAAQGVGYPGTGYQAVITNLPRSWVTKTTGVPW